MTNLTVFYPDYMKSYDDIKVSSNEGGFLVFEHTLDGKSTVTILNTSHALSLDLQEETIH